ncbi:unnamed protein product [marine sediment metagenome]|uniref:Uncharacterized protein n=1 Tax=marine sediment metagenome TaxID=412755 RepID=X0VD29_9ZZZZ
MTRRYYPEENTEEQLDYLLNSGLTFIDNMRCSILDLDLDEGLNEIQHGLDYIPLGYFVIYKTEEGDIWGTDQQSWTESTLSLRSSVPNQKARLIVL